MNNQKKLLSQLEKGFNENNRLFLYKIITESNYVDTASSINEIFLKSTNKLRENLEYREAFLYSVELLLMLNIKKRTSSKKVSPIFSNSFYNVLGSI